MKGTCDEHQVMYGSTESLCCTTETIITMYVNELEFKNFLKKKKYIAFQILHYSLQITSGNYIFSLIIKAHFQQF